MNKLKLNKKIDAFIDRKTSQFPEIDDAADRLINDWR